MAMTDPLTLLRASSEHLSGVVVRLDDDHLDAPAYPSEWSFADVLSHVGSGAVILQRRLEDIIADRETPSEFSQSVWDNWNAKSSVDKRADGLVADRALVTRLASISDAQRSGFRFAMGPFSEDFDGFVGLRLSEHVLHTWDIEVLMDPGGTLSPEATEYLIDRLELIARFTGRASDVDPRVSVRTTNPQRHFALSLGPEAVTFAPSAPEADPDLDLPSEAFIRLVYGRLDPAHTPALKGHDLLVNLRRVFPGP
jgi:uncharacterized protein (TIGR03083 family)